jgi:HAD superfamily hydrolase (TIGR01509 family)
VLVSAEEGVAKPDPELYLRACHRLGVAPACAGFVDDREENVVGARSAGLHAEVFVSAHQLVALSVGARSA